jgi:C-terminal processing protease CtpA/Prc
MKKSFAIVALGLSFAYSAFSQSPDLAQFNFDFEQNAKNYPSKWEDFGGNDYKIYVDAGIAQKGRFSVVIEHLDKQPDYKALSFKLPKNYEGKYIRLSGYIKTENVTEGYAGLWMRIDPQVGFDNMNNRGITGTTDWKKYEVSLPLDPKNTDQIYIGGLLVGKGKMWLDNLEVTIDGKKLDDKNVKAYLRQLAPAEKDSAYNTGSAIVFPAMNDGLLNNLELLGRVWGFLKYHHPAIAIGNYNWDFELFRVLPQYLNATTNAERDLVLANWVDKYGAVPVCANCKPTEEDAVLKPNLSWIDDARLSASLQAKLKAVYAGRAMSKHYYIDLTQNIRNPIFKNEKGYTQMPYPDAGFRLLALYKYWNMIAYFFPYKHQTDKDWNSILKAYIPAFMNAANELEYELAALKIIGEIQDTHANLWGGGNKLSELRGSNFAPFRVEFVQDQLVVTDYYKADYNDADKLSIGDVITHINGKTVEAIVDSLRPYYPASNEPTKRRDMAFDLLRSPQTTLNIAFLSAGQAKQQTLTLYERKQLNMYGWYKVNASEKCYKLLTDSIGYITLATIKNDDIPEIKKQFRNTKGIVVDIRNYPSTFVPFALGTYFMTAATPFVKFTSCNPNNPGEFTFGPELNIPKEADPYTGKVIVLVNEYSQSQAEYTTMAFRAGPNTKVVGSTTAGADGDVSSILLPGGLRTMISGLGVYYPNGTPTQRVGIVPDLVARPTIEGIKAKKDEVLEKAIALINQ